MRSEVTDGNKVKGQRSQMHVCVGVYHDLSCISR